MREHKYRGLTFNGKRVYGSLLETEDRSRAYIGYVELIEDGDMEDIHYDEVIPKTVGQYIGQRDSKRTQEYPEGQEIWEGDILGGTNADNEAIRPFVVRWEHGMYPLYDSFDGFDYTSLDYVIEMGYDLFVIGNEHENPELLEAKP